MVLFVLLVLGGLLTITPIGYAMVASACAFLINYDLHKQAKETKDASNRKGSVP